MNVALHYRGGDLCLQNRDMTKCEPLERVAATIDSVQRVMKQQFNILCVIHFFTQAPTEQQTSWQEFVAPLAVHLAVLNTTANVTYHISLKSEATFHAMATMPILIAGGSGFPKVAALYRHGVTVGRNAACTAFSCIRAIGTINEERFAGIN